MKSQRLRNLTTGILHTDAGCIYKDLEFITGIDGLMTHMLPNIMRAVKPWLKERVADAKYWNGEFDQSHEGEYQLEPMDDAAREEMLIRYKSMPSPLFGKDIITVKV